MTELATAAFPSRKRQRRFLLDPVAHASGSVATGPHDMPRLRLDPEAADARGLVAVGGDLRPETLLTAYRRGVFTWYDEGLPVCWWSPDPRAVIPLDHLHVSRRLA